MLKCSSKMAIYTERLNLRIGDPISWPKIEQDSVVEVIDPLVGHLVVAQKTGNVHAWWGSWVRGNGPDQMRKVLVHHGGRFGWNDIQTPIDQHNNVLKKYLGHEVVVDSVSDASLTYPHSFSEFLTAVRIAPEIVEVQGRRAWIGEAHYHIDRAIRGMVFPMNATEMNSRRAELERLQPILVRSTNPNIRSAGRNLGEGLVTEGGAKIRAFRRSDDNLLNSLLEMNDIVIGTFERGAALDRYRNATEDIIIEIHKRVTEAKANWDGLDNDDERQRVVARLTNLFGVPYLSAVKVQPFRSWVEELFADSHIDQVPDLWLGLNYSGISRALTRAEDRLERLSSRIRIRHQGAVQLKLHE